MNFIKGVLGENLSKSNQKNDYSNQKIVANTLSQNKLKEISIKMDAFIKSGNEGNLENNLDFRKIRGLYDFKALNERYKDTSIYDFYLPSDETQSQYYELLNACRCLKFGFEEFIGCKINITQSLKNPESIFDFNIDKKKNFFFKSIINFLEDKKIDYAKFENFFPQVNFSEIKRLFNHIHNQEIFFLKAKKILKKIENEVKKNQTQNSNNEDKLKSDKVKSKEKEKKKIPFSQEVKKKNKKDLDNNQNPSLSKNITEISKTQYKAYTKEFDISRNAKYLATKDELRSLRKKFDDEYLENKRLINKLAKKLERLFSSLNVNSWKFDQEEGYLDPSRLANLVANSKNTQIFKFENENNSKNTIVTLLLDNSGSMRGKPIITSAITTEIITKVLEKCKVNVEVLGFTTREWKGGKSKKKWEKFGKIENPGRLNDLLHIIYKDADVFWKNCKDNLGLILKDGLLKENIDGEAVKWAYNRLILRKEKKKILMVISDGAPVDDSTLSSNQPDILDNHLKETVEDIEKANSIKLIAIGIGHDVSKYYKNAFVIEDAENLGDVIISNLTNLLGNNKN